MYQNLEIFFSKWLAPHAQTLKVDPVHPRLDLIRKRKQACGVFKRQWLTIGSRHPFGESSQRMQDFFSPFLPSSNVPAIQ